MFVRTGIAVLALALARAAAGADADTNRIEIVSPHRDAVSVTIYRDLFALVTETRTVDLPAGPATLVFDDVVETLIPTSAVVSDLGRALDESNYSFDPLNPRSLLAASIGKKVVLTRTHPRTGKVTQVDAVVLSADESGVVLRTADGAEALRCAGLPEHLTFEQLPAELTARPRLSVRIAAGSPGRRTIKLSYIAHGFRWNSNYIADMNTAGIRMDLAGWLTIENLTGASFSQAAVQVVAGKLNLVDRSDGGTSRFGPTADLSDEQSLQDARDGALELMREELEPADYAPSLFSGCYASPSDKTFMTDAIADGPLHRSGGDELQEIVMVTGYRASMAVRENLADYQMYRLPWPTDLAARQTKQAKFLDKRGVKVKRFYEVTFDAEGLEDDEPVFTAWSTVAWTNNHAAGLGEPMPGGTVRIFDRNGDGRVFSGEDRLADRPVGTPVELRVGAAFDVAAEFEDIAEPKDNTADVRVRLTNARAIPAPIVMRQTIPEEYIARPRVTHSNVAVKRDGNRFTWKLVVPPNDDAYLTYRYEWDDKTD